jgi:hypothetical protein
MAPDQERLRQPVIDEIGSKSESEPNMKNGGPSRGWLYDVDGEDSPIRVDGAQLPKIGKRQMLWVDIDLDAAGPLDELWDQLGIPDLSETFAHGDSRPHLVRYPGFLHLNVFATTAPNWSRWPFIAWSAKTGSRLCTRAPWISLTVSTSP